MSDNETKRCARCGSLFECRAQEIERCQCASVVLSTETLALLRERFTGCLCIDCLRQINAQPAAPVYPAAGTPL